MKYRVEEMITKTSFISQEEYDAYINAMYEEWAVVGIIHAWIDDIKVNHLDFNLIEDQSFHCIQITLVFFFSGIMLVSQPLVRSDLFENYQKF